MPTYKKNFLKDNWLAIALTAVAFYFLFKKKDEDIKDIYNKTIDKKKLSYPIANYKIWADSIQEMCVGGTDEQGIYDTFKKLKNNTDFEQLVKSFGKRTYTGGYNPLDYVGLTNKIGLVDYLKYDMLASEIKRINWVLADRKITYRL
jgi:hypothetical protein